MKRTFQVLFSAVLALALTGSSFMGSAYASSVPSDNGLLEQRLNGEVHHALAMIPQYSIFDDLSYHVEGNTVTLSGAVRNAIVSDEAQASVKHIEGVERVVNNIEILPASFNDDRIRREVARAVFGDARMSSYAIQPVPPIHIIVKNGHVDLVGVVRTKTDADSAFIRANGVPGVFSVNNDLRIEQPARG